MFAVVMKCWTPPSPLRYQKKPEAYGRGTRRPPRPHALRQTMFAQAHNSM
jgi:hypothetical protein